MKIEHTGILINNTTGNLINSTTNPQYKEAY